MIGNRPHKTIRDRTLRDYWKQLFLGPRLRNERHCIPDKNDFFFFFFWKNVRAKFLLLNWAIYPGQEGRGESLGNFFYSWIFSFFARINSHPVKFSPFLFLYKHHKCLKLIANHEVEDIRMRIFEKIRYFENFKN